MLKIPQQIHDDIIVHAREGLPLEVCGILGGRGDAVEAMYRVTNSDASNEHFSMEPKEQFAVVKDMRIKGMKMLAIYHSHPETPARPSEEDIRLALTPGISYVIVSMMAPDAPTLRSFKISDGQVENEEVQVV
jgi:proteasome lid subunit RPN8/RPN11